MYNDLEVPAELNCMIDHLEKSHTKFNRISYLVLCIHQKQPETMAFVRHFTVKQNEFCNTG